MRPDPFELAVSPPPVSGRAPGVREGRLFSLPHPRHTTHPVISHAGSKDSSREIVAGTGEWNAQQNDASADRFPAEFPTWTDDDDIVEAVKRDGITRVKVTRPTRTTVVLGRGSKPRVELNLDACLADDVPIERRRGGGCSVVLDPGNLVVSVAAKVPGLGNIQSSFDRLTAWVIDGLARAGIPGVNVQGTSDLALGERKVGGSCIQRSRDLLTFSTTLLVAPDLTSMDRYLAHPPREPEYRKGRPHSDFVTTLPAPHGIEALRADLARILTDDSAPTP